MAIWADLSAANKVRRARQKLFANRQTQFWGSLGMSMGLVEDNSFDTAATDAVNIYYNDLYINGLTEDECIGLLAHEISHPALDHFKRQGDRDGPTWNMSGDYEINLDLVKAGLTLPQGALLDYRFDGLSAEQIHSVITRENKEDERNGRPARHKPGSGDMVKPKNVTTGQPMSGDEQAALADQWQERVAQSLGAARKAGKLAGGDIPSSLQAVSATLKAVSIIDWRQPLRAFIDDLGSKHDTWNSFSRRGITRGLYQPGETVIRPSVIGWYVDVSSSMDATKNEQAAIEAQAALDDMACDAIELVYVNTRVVGTDRYEIGDKIELKSATSGGTDFRSAMAYAKDQTYAAIVFVTDGQTSSWGIDPECPVLWAITDTIPATEKLAPPFGEKLCLYTS